MHGSSAAVDDGLISINFLKISVDRAVGPRFSKIPLQKLAMSLRHEIVKVYCRTNTCVRAVMNSHIERSAVVEKIRN